MAGCGAPLACSAPGHRLSRVTVVTGVSRVTRVPGVTGVPGSGFLDGDHRGD